MGAALSDNQLAPGLQGQALALVRPQDLASAYGNPGVDVMSSMTLMTLLEQSCILALAGHLAPGWMTVGARMEMDHLAPTPEGFTVTARAELSEVAGRKLVFAIVAHDGVEEVARAKHTRFVVDGARFLAGVAAKAGKGGAS
ncbi:MAG: thioesterase [Desulfovibrio sp.]|nr:thioesterase [Desulfovibrio sp.]